MTEIKSELKSFALKLRKELVKRDKYFFSKSESWQESDTGEKYLIKTDMLQELWSSIETALNDFNIKIPYLK